jgi:hypothetical protein
MHWSRTMLLLMAKPVVIIAHCEECSILSLGRIALNFDVVFCVVLCIMLKVIRVRSLSNIAHVCLDDGILHVIWYLPMYLLKLTSARNFSMTLYCNNLEVVECLHTYGNQYF